MSQLCGPFPINFLKTTKKWRSYFHKNGKLKNVKIERIDWMDLLKEHNIPSDQIDDLIDLFKNMLKINPKHRMSINKILNHKWLVS